MTNSESGHDGGKGIVARLSVAMLLELLVFGSWFSTLGLVLSHYGMASIIGDAYLLSALAAIVAPLFLGAVGDRYMAPRYVFALAHLVGALIMVAIPFAIQSGNAPLTLALIFAHMLMFQPTLALVISISLDLLGKRQDRFPYVRLFAPLGWVIAGLAVGAMGLSASTGLFIFTAAAEFILAAYALTLPYRAPPAKGARFSVGDLIGVKALVLFKQRSFSVVMLCILLTSISLGFYNTFGSLYLDALGISNVAGVLALGQASEVVFICTIPWVLSRIGMKWALFLGMGMWGVRFALFVLAADGKTSLAIIGVGLHGICSDYFIVIGAMFIAKLAPAELAAQAQGWLTLMISGFGAAIGSWVSGAIFTTSVAPQAQMGAAAWTPLWLVPIGLAAATSVLWLALMRPVGTAGRG